MLCTYCGKNEASGGVFCSDCYENRPRELTLLQFKDVLERIQKRIAAGTPLTRDDCNVTGYKHTHCSWGVCTNSISVWNTPELHIWPMYFLSEERVAPLSIPAGCKCPLDQRAAGDRLGCFYYCAAFNPPEPHMHLVAAHANNLYLDAMEALKDKE